MKKQFVVQGNDAAIAMHQSGEVGRAVPCPPSDIGRAISIALPSRGGQGTARPTFAQPMADRLLGLISLCFALASGLSYAGPQGMTVVSGAAHAVQQGSVLQITTSQSAFLQWNSFNIAAGETTVFHQPSASSIVFNNIRDANPTTIFGSLRANGIVV